jgi:uncharacterized tellurite resistance protein B-like protein
MKIIYQRITAFFESTMSVTASDSQEDTEHKKQMAAAALFIEVLKSDYEHRDEEWAAVETALNELFELSSDEIARITALAEEEVQNATSLQGFTRCVNEQYSNDEKVKIVEMLWRVALADGVIDKHENHVMRKIGSLLYIPHKDYVRAKQQARLHPKLS